MLCHVCNSESMNVLCSKCFVACHIICVDSNLAMGHKIRCPNIHCCDNEILPSDVAFCEICKRLRAKVYHTSKFARSDKYICDECIGIPDIESTKCPNCNKRGSYCNYTNYVCNYCNIIWCLKCKINPQEEDCDCISKDFYEKYFIVSYSLKFLDKVPEEYHTEELINHYLTIFPGNELFLMSKDKVSEEEIISFLNIYPKVLRFVPLEFQSVELCLEFVRKNGLVLEYVINKTYDICLTAVKNSGNAIRFVPENFHTVELCMSNLIVHIDENFRYVKCRDPDFLLHAVKMNGNNLQYIEEQYQTEEICMEAVKSNPRLFRCCALQTEEIVNYVLERDGTALSCVKNQTLEICWMAVKNEYLAFQFVQKEFQTTEMCIYVLRKEGGMIFAIKDPTQEMKYEAVKKNGGALYHFPDRSEEFCLMAVKSNHTALNHISEEYQTEEICLEAVKRGGLSLKHVINQTPKICYEAVKQNVDAIEFIRDPDMITEEMCILVIKNYHSKNIRYIPNKFSHLLPEIVLDTPDKIKFVNEFIRSTISPEIYLSIVKSDGLLLKYVPHNIQLDNPDIMDAAFEQNPISLKYAVNKSEEMCRIAFSKDHSTFPYLLPHLREELRDIMIEKNYFFIKV